MSLSCERNTPEKANIALHLTASYGPALCGAKLGPPSSQVSLTVKLTRRNQPVRLKHGDQLTEHALIAGPTWKRSFEAPPTKTPCGAVRHCSPPASQFCPSSWRVPPPSDRLSKPGLAELSPSMVGQADMIRRELFKIIFVEAYENALCSARRR